MLRKLVDVVMRTVPEDIAYYAKRVKELTAFLETLAADEMEVGFPKAPTLTALRKRQVELNAVLAEAAEEHAAQNTVDAQEFDTHLAIYLEGLSDDSLEDIRFQQAEPETQSLF